MSKKQKIDNTGAAEQVQEQSTVPPPTYEQAQEAAGAGTEATTVAGTTQTNGHAADATTAPVSAPVTLVKAESIVYIDPDAFIIDNARFNARAFGGGFNDAKFKDLMTSIEQIGVIQPVLFTTSDDAQARLHAGFRRVEAVKRLHLKYPDDPRFASVPAVQLDTEDGVLLLQASLAENNPRKELSQMDYAHAIKQLEDAGMKGKDIAASMGKSGGWVTQRRALLKLPEELQRKVHEGELDAQAAYELSKKPVEVQQAAVDGFAGTVEEAEQPDAGTSTGKSKSKSKGKGKTKAKPGRLTKSAARSAKVGTKGKSKGKLVTDGPRSRDEVRRAFSGIEQDQELKPTVRAVAKALGAFMDGKASDKVLRGRLDDNCKRG